MIDQGSLIALAGAISNEKKDTYLETTATVVSSGSEIWVRLEGSTQSTPITSTTVKVAQGDTVTVRIADGKAVITGNVSNPATDDTVAAEAKYTADVARATADETAETFYADAGGAHIDGAAYRNDLTSNGMELVEKKSGSKVAKFTKDVVSLLSGAAKLIADRTSGIINAASFSIKAEPRDNSSVRAYTKYLSIDIPDSIESATSETYASDSDFCSSLVLKTHDVKDVSAQLSAETKDSPYKLAEFHAYVHGGVSHAVATADHIEVNGLVPLMVKSKQITNQTSSVSTTYRQFTQTIDSYDGYKPVAVVGLSLYNSSVWAVNRCYLSSDTQVSFTLRDMANSKAQSMTGTSYVYILYVRKELL